MSEKVQKADFELKYRVWELQSLYDVGLSIARTLDLESLADDVLMTSVSPERALRLSPRARAEGRGLLRQARGRASPERGRDLRGARGGRPREHAGEPARLSEGRARREAPPRPDRGREPSARRARRRGQGDVGAASRTSRPGGREGREPVREPGGDRARERAPPPRGGREGEDGARDGARGLHPEDDSSRGASGSPGPPAGRRQPADEAGRRRLLRRLSAAGRADGPLRRGRLGEGRPRGAPRVHGPRLPPPPHPEPLGRPSGPRRAGEQAPRPLLVDPQVRDALRGRLRPGDGRPQVRERGPQSRPLARAGRRDAPAERRRAGRDAPGRRSPRGVRDPRAGGHAPPLLGRDHRGARP